MCVQHPCCHNDDDSMFLSICMCFLKLQRAELSQLLYTEALTVYLFLFSLIFSLPMNVFLIIPQRDDYHHL